VLEERERRRLVLVPGLLLLGHPVVVQIHDVLLNFGLLRDLGCGRLPTGTGFHHLLHRAGEEVSPKNLRNPLARAHRCGALRHVAGHPGAGVCHRLA
jgi:hypothetical protein